MTAARIIADHLISITFCLPELEMLDAVLDVIQRLDWDERVDVASALTDLGSLDLADAVLMADYYAGLTA